MMNKNKKEAATQNPLKALIWSIYAPTLVYTLGTGALNAVLVLAAIKVGFDPSQASSQLGIFGLVGVFAAPMVGAGIARIGEAASMRIASVLAVIALIASLASLANAHTLAAKMVFTGAIVALSVAANVWSLARQAYIAASLHPRYRARALGTLGGMLRVGILLGPAIGALVISVFGIKGVYYLQIVTTLTALALVIQFAVPNPQSGSEMAAASSSVQEDDYSTTAETAPKHIFFGRDARATMILGVGSVILAFMRAARNVVLPLWGHHLGFDPEIISAVFAGGALVDTLLCYPSGRLVERYGRMSGILPTLVFMGVALLYMPFTSGIFTYLLAAGILGLGNGFGCGIMMTMGADLSPVQGRAKFLGYWQAIANMGSTIGPFTIAAFTATTTLPISLWVCAGISLAGAAWMFFGMPKAYARLGMDTKGRILKNYS